VCVGSLLERVKLALWYVRVVLKRRVWASEMGLRNGNELRWRCAALGAVRLSGDCNTLAISLSQSRYRAAEYFIRKPVGTTRHPKANRRRKGSFSKRQLSLEQPVVRKPIVVTTSCRDRLILKRTSAGEAGTYFVRDGG